LASSFSIDYLSGIFSLSLLELELEEAEGVLKLERSLLQGRNLGVGEGEELELLFDEDESSELNSSIMSSFSNSLTIRVCYI